jgi:hypothetical protein
MRKLLLCGALAAATAVPALAQAQSSTPRCVNPQTNATAGALIGAAGGALVGSQLASRGSRDKGAILGALGGALLGGSIGNSQVRCPEGYYRYEGGHYYDNSGAEYRPSGYAPPPPPAYGAPPPPPAYGPPPGPGYDGPRGGFWEGAPERIADRIAFTEERVHRAEDRGWIDHREARRAYRDIAGVRQYESDARARNYGKLRPEDREYILDKLNYISQRVRWDAHN